MTIAEVTEVPDWWKDWFPDDSGCPLCYFYSEGHCLREKDGGLCKWNEIWSSSDTSKSDYRKRSSK